MHARTQRHRRLAHAPTNKRRALNSAEKSWLVDKMHPSSEHNPTMSSGEPDEWSARMAAPAQHVRVG